MMVREAPLNLAHWRNMTAVTEMGGIIFPPVAAFYHHPKTMDEMVDHTVARVLDLFGIHVLGPRWEGEPLFPDLSVVDGGGALAAQVRHVHDFLLHASRPARSHA